MSERQLPPAPTRQTPATNTASEIRHLEIACLVLDAGTQPREKLSDSVVREYAQDMKAGADFQPIIVFYDGTSYVLADGFHRVKAAALAGKTTLRASIKPGTARDALLWSFQANYRHGVRRTSEDKRRSVMRMLSDDEWGNWSDHKVAEACMVTQPFVSKLRKTVDSTRGAFAPRKKATITCPHCHKVIDQ